MPTECIETVSLDTEPELEEALHEQSNPAADSSSKASRWGAWGTWGKSLLSSASATVVSGSDQEELGKHLKLHVYKAAVPPVFLSPGICSIDRLPDPGIR
ncbi:protein Noxp20-like, partial [Cyanistes caeruleus]|uniref:protein Noxp20-like n=1 Tax=Cyanistes caeruleus TaxID=156563 RepID=UPI000CDB9567